MRRFGLLAVALMVMGSAQAGLPPQSAAPHFSADAAWPHPLPHHWILGQIGGLYVDRHDHVWVYQRPRTLTNEEAGEEDAIATDRTGRKINGLGFARLHGPISECCRAAPSVLEFDTAGKLLRAWGGPADKDFLASKCRAPDGCLWPSLEHGIYVDDEDNIWLAGSSAAAPVPTPWSTNLQGGDGMVLKFDSDGNFKLRIGGPSSHADSNNTDGGLNGTALLFQAADMAVDAQSHRLFIADGYGNRRVLIVDARTGRYLGHFGAYGNNPVDDTRAAAAPPWISDLEAGRTKPAFFRTPVHCVKLARDGKIYVCDRANNRIQVFDGRDPALGKPCQNPDGMPNLCGYLAEQSISAHTNTDIAGTAVSVAFSSDRPQSCLYVADISNMTVHVLDRASLREIGRVGRPGTMAGQFHWLHQLGADSKGNLYSGEVDSGKRVQKFVRSGPLGCGGPASVR